MDGGHDDGAFVSAQTRDAACREKLRQLPADGVDGRDEADQQGGTGHGCDEEREDGAEGCKAERHAKEAAVYKTYGEVVFQVLFVFFFQICEHGWIVIHPIFL